MTPRDPISRREFIWLGGNAGAGLVLALVLPDARRLARRLTSGAAPGPAEPRAFAPDAFVQIARDGSVTITVHRPEMGQGVRTALPMLVAEELEVPWEAVRVVQADLDPDRYGDDQWTGGSAVVRQSWEPLRRVGAVARAMLVGAAARRWGVEPAACRAESGAVVHAASGRRLSYGELAEAARAIPVPADVPLKPPSAFRVIGTRRRSVDAPAIVDGSMHFGIDVRVPGMLFAVVERSPVFGGRPVRVDDARARAVPGVRAVVTIDADAMPDFADNAPKPPNGVAVVATSTWAAMQGRRALRVEWDARGGEAESTDALRRAAVAAAAAPARWVIRDDGDATRALAGAARSIEAVYEIPFVAHTPMEPMNCTADVRADRCEIWAPTQNPAGARDAAQRLTKLEPGAIAVHPIRMGGAFGRRFYADYVAEAVHVSRAARAPVQVVWTREDDVRHDYYRPNGYHVLRGAVDAEGWPVAWTHRLVNASRDHYLGGSADRDPGELSAWDFPAGFVPNFRLEYTPLQSRIPRGQWRAVEDSQNVFVVQSFLDELAHLARRDPLALRLAMLEPARELKYYDKTWDTGRLAAVLRLAAERGGWGTPLPAGRGRGLACSYANSAYVAHVCEVETTDTTVRVLRVVTAVDCGIVVNPQGAEAQVQSAILYGLSAALGQEITVKDGRVRQGNFDDFPAVRIGEAPRMEVYFVPSDQPVRGLGEGPLPGIGPAVGNAIFAASGRRVRKLPVGPGSRA